MSRDCDECELPATFEVFAAYPLALDNDPHPRVAHYPGAMIRACGAHLAERLGRDASTFGSTKGWFVEMVPAPSPSVGETP